ncbi:DNA-binding protein [Pseudomonas syringae pv. syringae]|uniref:DNA-binding protein n=1 Tax=Pseudomonas syringae TaxID=317 RepID=UPI00200AAB17|nr:DNA-binding protein [Pseudomonas syringae]MCK9712299.1 DNA-binding protein [Pseudomonas syringae pv. syringae]
MAFQFFTFEQTKNDVSLDVISLDVIRYEIVGAEMARGGINKAVVQKARHALLARGINPTIDKVRAELGNTGSNTTISRYLRELESVEPSAESTGKKLGGQLTSIVESLLNQLLEEGAQAADSARAEFDIERATSQALVADLQAELASSQRNLANQREALKLQAAELQTSQSSLQAELTRNAGIAQRCGDLEVLLAEKEKQIQSLEEKHVHARGALEHYRDSVKEQRDQDQRRHESQLHQAQVEQRKLQETLVLKQDDLTRLNRDNERLLGDSRQQVKALHAHETRLQNLAGEIHGLKLAEAKAAGVSEQHLEQIATLRQEAKALSETAAKSSERELESRLQLASAQAENAQLRRELANLAQCAQSNLATVPTTVFEKPDAKPLKTPRK